MSARVVRRSSTVRNLPWVAVGIAINFACVNPQASAGLGSRRADPAQVLPIDQLAPEHRETVAEVIRDHSFHRQGEPETFPCNGTLYLNLLNEPLVPLSL